MTPKPTTYADCVAGIESVAEQEREDLAYNERQNIMSVKVRDHRRGHLEGLELALRILKGARHE